MAARLGNRGYNPSMDLLRIALNPDHLKNSSNSSRGTGAELLPSEASDLYEMPSGKAELLPVNRPRSASGM
jgi:hypothetical protein